MQFHAALQLRVRHGAVAVRVLPRPEAGALLALDERVAAPFGVDQRDVALVLLALLIEEREDAGRAGHGHDDRGDLLRDLTDRLHEAPRELEERGDRAERHDVHAGEREVRRAEKGHEAAEHGDQHVQGVAERVHDRAEDVCEFVRFRGVFEQVLVPFVKGLLRLVLVAEDLDDLLAVDHFLHVAVDVAERLLLPHEIAAAFRRDLADDLEHQKQEHDDENRQPDAQRQHREEYGDNGEERGNRLRNALRDHLAQRVGIVRVVAHHVAVRVRVEVFERQRLHVREHVVADGFQRALRDDRHDAVVEQRGERADDVDDRHLAQGEEQAGEDRCGFEQERRNVIVDQPLQEQRGHDAGKGADRNADEHEDELEAVWLHIGKQPLQRLFVELLQAFLHGKPRAVRTWGHCRRLLSSGIRIPRGRSGWTRAALRACRRP